MTAIDWNARTTRTRSFVAIFEAMRGAPAIGGAGVDTKREAAHVASHYRYFRNVRHMPATAALEAAKALPADYVKGREYYGPSGGAGAPDGDGLRWIESTAGAGLRFVGYAADLCGRYYGSLPTGYYTDAEGEYSTLRAAVWQLPGKGRHARLVAGYQEFDGKSETNPGSARIDCRTIYRAEMDSYGDLTGHDETREAARAADGIAESAAETEREYQQAYAAGRAAAELDAELIAARREALPLLKEMRLLKGSASFRLAYGDKGADAPAIRKAICGKVESLLETISEKREARESAWGNVWRGADLEPWLAGFMDESSFVRAVRLGYAKATDWRGKPEDNPCYQ